MPCVSLFAVKFFTLDDSVMFILTRVPERGSMPAGSPHALPPRARIAHARSTSALEHPNDEPDLVRRSGRIYCSNVLAAASRASSPAPPGVGEVHTQSTYGQSFVEEG
jgi:hypothetical protein